MKTLTRLAFGLWICLMVCLAAATFLEKHSGSDYVARYVYHTSWFVGLWGALAAAATCVIIGRAIYLRKTAILLHLSFLLILAGALLTFSFSKKGFLHLREGETSQQFQSENDASPIPLPFALRLDRFEIQYYRGTLAPADYLSHLTLLEGSEQRPVRISMNRILAHRGWRFYQTSFDNDRKGSVLSVNYDPYGTPVTYAGYLCLGIAMIGVLLDKRSGFRKLLRHPLWKRSLPLVCFLGFSGLSPLQAAPATLSSEAASAFGRLRVLYGDRVVPLQTLARDFTLKIYGKPHYQNYSPEQVLCGWVFFPEQWQHEPMIRIKSDTIRRLIRSGNGRNAPFPEHTKTPKNWSKLVTFTDFFTPQRRYKLADLPIRTSNPQGKVAQAIAEADEKIQLIVMLQAGQLLTIFPHDSAGQIRWSAPTDPLPNLPTEDSILIRGFFPLLYEAVNHGEESKIRSLIDKIDRFQRQRGAVKALPENRLQAERIYNRLDTVSWLYRFNLSWGFLAFVYFGWSLLSGRRKRSWETVFLIPVLLSLTLLSITLALRGYIAGHLPLSNGYETMMFIAGCVLLVTLLIRRRFPPATASGLILSGFALLVAALGSMNPRITSLMPVLNSPWLSLHVSLIMVSYTLLGFILLNGLSAMIVILTGKDSRSNTIPSLLKRLQRLSQILLYPAVFLLAAGIFVGAVWANVSWGRYWGWDPKEVWALITLMLYALPLHVRSLPRFRHPFFFHTFAIWAFLSVLMTYFGVNYFLGGVHSYAGTLSSRSLGWILTGCLLCPLLLTLAAYRVYRQNQR